MSIARQEAIDYTITPWLLASALVTTLPHALHQPHWLSVLAALIFAWAGWLWRKDRRLPGRWLLLAIVAVGTAGVLVEFRTLFGRDAGVALLVLFMAMKLLELRSRRDATVVIVLGYFLLLTHYFYSQSIATGAWLLVAMCLLTASLIRLNGGPPGWRENLRHAATLTLQAAPFMLVLFVLFPRVGGPLWGLPQDAHSGKTGLSDSMAPGSIANLVRNGEIAFRVRFAGDLPARDRLYWRGPVMEDFDGLTWRRSERKYPPERLMLEGSSISYEMTLEGHNQRWLLALDAPDGLADGMRLDGRMSVLSARPVNSRQRFRLSAALDYRLNVDEDPRVLRQNLSLPDASNLQTRALAGQWRARHTTDEAVVREALALFAEPDFSYTLQPPLLGTQAIDDFLFRSRQGFCEHYAAAFVVLMRAAGIPARVVGGYQGGEMNPRDGFLVVRQSDAHAWSEVWLENRGWVRVDPTAVVAPARIGSGIAEALPAGEALPALLRLRGDWLRDLRHRWEAFNNAWQQHVLGYDARRQRDLLSDLGLPDADWQKLAMLLGGSCTLLLGLLAWWSLRQGLRQDPRVRLWRRALRKIRVDCAPGETPLALLTRLQTTSPALARALAPVVQHYLLARYAPENSLHLSALRVAVQQLHRRRKP